MKNRFIITSAILMFINCLASAQSVIGFWGVTGVSVGSRNMTPVSKWIKIKKDGTAIGGNGWTQNSVGTWTYNEKTSEIVPTNDLGTKDEFGPFKVSFSEDTMKWTRLEEGIKVVVSLVTIKEMSPAPTDLVKGLWTLSKAEDSNGNVLKDYDEDGKQFMFIRPDMRFRLRSADAGITQGFWHMDGHRPILTLINYDRTINNQEYTVSFVRDMLVMKSRNEERTVYYYSRINEFPK